MKCLKNAIVYRLSLPSALQLAVHLDELKHTEIQPPEPWKYGFVPVPGCDNPFALVETLPGTGMMAFAVRMDDKLMPGSVINAMVKERCEEIAKSTGRTRVSKAERLQVKDMVVSEVCRTALVKTQVVTCFYDPLSRFLFVPAPKRQAGIITNLLVRAVGAAKSETINVSNVKGGLTARLRSYIDEREGFDQGFVPNSAVWLRKGSERVTIQLDSDVTNATRAISEALDNSFEVVAIRLEHEATDVSFRLTDEFHLKGIDLPDVEIDKDAGGVWQQEAAVQLTLMVRLMGELCVMFDYKEPAEDAPADAEAVEA